MKPSPKDTVKKQKKTPQSPRRSASGGLIERVAARKKQWVVAEDRRGERLDAFLVSVLGGVSRSSVQKLIKNGGVAVNEEKPSVHRFLKVGDTIVLAKEKKSERPVEIKKRAAAKIPNPKIVFENEEFIILDKPAGLLAHESEGSRAPAVTDFLLAHYPPIAKIGEDPSRPGIMHRLDKDVSGLMVVAKTQDAFDTLKKQFQQRKVKKTYIALAHGEFSKSHDVIDFPIERTVGGKMAARPKGAEGKKAVTEFEVIQTFHHYTLLRLKLMTGRTHQIRVHLFAYGNPLVGDTLYRRKKVKPEPLGRVFLHAAELGFSDTGGEWHEFSSPLPPKLKEFLKTLKEK